MPVIYRDFEQNSPEWFAVRAGIPTASEFENILPKGKGKMRLSYMRKLAAEIITKEPEEQVSAYALKRGHIMEPIARETYAFITDTSPDTVAFIKSDDGKIGCSPDALIDNNGILEIKTKKPDFVIECIENDVFVEEHKAQCQGILWVSEREWIDLVVYYPKTPLFVKRAYRDEKYIKTLAEQVDIFNAELSAMVERVLSYQPFKSEEEA